MKNAFVICLVFLTIVFGSSSVSAHPHVWVTIHSEVIYGPTGAVTGIRHAWSFDDMFSAYAVQGMPQTND